MILSVVKKILVINLSCTAFPLFSQWSPSEPLFLPLPLTCLKFWPRTPTHQPQSSLPPPQRHRLQLSPHKHEYKWTYIYRLRLIRVLDTMVGHWGVDYPWHNTAMTRPTLAPWALWASVGLWGQTLRSFSFLQLNSPRSWAVSWPNCYYYHHQWTGLRQTLESPPLWLLVVRAICFPLYLTWP